MFCSMIASNRFRIAVGLVLALVLVTAGCIPQPTPVVSEEPIVIPETGEKPEELMAVPDMQGSMLEFDLRSGKDNPANELAQPEKFYAPEIEEGKMLEFDLRSGKDNLVPASSPDFGTSYWLVVGPAGDEPVSTGP